MKSTNQSGRTMLEMLGVLGIMGIITYGAIAGINYGMSSYKINQTYSEVQDIIQGVEDLYSWSQKYASRADMMAAACANDIFTNSRSCSPSENPQTVQGPFGDMWLEPVDAMQNFRIHISIANSDDCTRLSQMDWKANSIKCENPSASGDNKCTCTEGSNNILYFSPL